MLEARAGGYPCFSHADYSAHWADHRSVYVCNSIAMPPEPLAPAVDETWSRRDRALRRRLEAVMCDPGINHVGMGVYLDRAVRGPSSAWSDGNWRRAARGYLRHHAPQPPRLWERFGKPGSASHDRRPRPYIVCDSSGAILRQAASPAVCRLIIAQRGVAGDYCTTVD